MARADCTPRVRPALRLHGFPQPARREESWSQASRSGATKTREQRRSTLPCLLLTRERSFLKQPPVSLPDRTTPGHGGRSTHTGSDQSAPGSRGQQGPAGGQPLKPRLPGALQPPTPGVLWLENGEDAGWPPIASSELHGLHFLPGSVTSQTART